MDTSNGYIYTPEQLEAMKKLVAENNDAQLAAAVKRMMQMDVPPTERQLSRTPPRVGRNEKCPCGSGKKFKKCCLGKSV